MHGDVGNKSASARRRELIGLIKEEFQRTEYQAEHSTRQLRTNIQKSIGNAKTEALSSWLEMLRNVKGETFYRKKFESIRTPRVQPITKFSEGWSARKWGK